MYTTATLEDGTHFRFSDRSGSEIRVSFDQTNREQVALSIYGDEPGILVQRSRINVRLRGTRTFIRDASRAEVAS
jgi:hypothetical protein